MEIEKEFKKNENQLKFQIGQVIFNELLLFFIISS